MMPKDDGFLNVDLEVGARTRALLAPLVEALHGSLFELFRGRIRCLYRAHYESRGCWPDASRTIHELAAAIEALDRAGRHTWDAAALRDFNVGVELARGVRSIELAIDSDAIRRVAALGGRIAFTTYQTAAMPKTRLDGATEPSDQKRKRPTPARKRPS